jgi:WD40 repeat protein
VTTAPGSRSSGPHQGERSASRASRSEEEASATPVVEFDVFLSYASGDSKAVRTIAESLRTSGLKPFLDRWQQIPGLPWQDALARALERSTTAAIFVGPSGINPWQDEEMRLALDRAVRTHDEFRVIPVLLPESNEASIPSFLSQRSWVDFRPGLDDAEAIQRLVAGVRGEAVVDGGYELPDEPVPYRGLLPFEAENADIFFGRDEDTNLLARKLEGNDFIAVIGASGTGKSSLVRAGLMRALSAAPGYGMEEWRVLVLRPGMDPLRSLARQVATLDEGPDRLSVIDSLSARFAMRDDGLRTALLGLLTPETHTTLLVVDQFEELFTLCSGTPVECRHISEQFVSNLADAVEHSRGSIKVVAALRADFLDKALSIPQLKELFQDRQVLLGPMDDQALREVIVRPAQLVGALFEKGLVQTIIRDVEAGPGSLPLLEHALHELWQRRRGPWLTLEAYEQSGGVTGALRRRAQSTYDSLSATQRGVARHVLLRLTTLGEGVLDTRRRVMRSELYPAEADPEDVDVVLQALSAEDARLIVVDQDTVEVAHEALLQQWDTMRAWLDEDREALRVHRRLTEAAAEWSDVLRRDPGALYRGAKLVEAEEWVVEHGRELNARESEFVEASRQRTSDELEVERRRSRRLRRRLVAAVVALIVAAGGGAVALWALSEATRAETEARGRELAALSTAVLPRDPELAALLAIESADFAAGQDDGLLGVSYAALYRAVSSPLRTSLSGHSDYVWRAQFNQDGSRIVTAGGDGIALVWDLETNEPSTLDGHEEVITSVEFNAEGGRIVTASEDRTARVWTTDGRHVAELEGHDGTVNSAEFSPDGTSIVTASSDQTARVWNLEGDELARLSGHDGTVNSAEFSPDGTSIVTASSDQTVRVWNLEGDELARLSGDDDVNSAKFSPDGTLVVTAGRDGIARVWSLDNDGSVGGRVRVLAGHDDIVWSAEFNHDGTRVVTASEDGTARVWEPDGELIAILATPGDALYAAAFSADGRRVVTAADDGTARLWDPDGSLITTLHARGDISSAILSPNGTRIVIVGADGSAVLWGSRGSRLAVLRGPEGAVSSARFDAAEDHVVTAGEDGRARVFGLDGTELANFNHGGNLSSAEFDPGGSRVVTAGTDKAVRVWNLGQDEPLAELSGHEDVVNSAVFSPDGNLIVTASRDGTARVWRPDGTQEAELPHDAEVMSARFSPDGSRIVTASSDRTARVWTPDGTPVAVLKGHTGTIWSAEFSEDGSRIVTAGGDRTARVWTPDGTPVAVLRGHTGVVRSAEFSEDGTRIVTASWDDTARVWSVHGTTLAVIGGTGGDVMSASFRPDGTRILIARADGIVQIHPSWSFDQALDLAIERHGDRGFTPAECTQYDIDPCASGS